MNIIYNHGLGHPTTYRGIETIEFNQDENWQKVDVIMKDENGKVFCIIHNCNITDITIEPEEKTG